MLKIIKIRESLLQTLAVMVLCLLPAIPQVQAQDLKSYAQKAVISNPEVTARLNALRAAINEIDVARGGYYPRVDLLANTGRERSEASNLNGGVQSFGRHTFGLTVTQMLWDGLATRNEVRRLGHAALVRYFEFIEASEAVALEAVRSYYDVQRFRELVDLAEANYIQHKQTFDQIEQRFKAGAGRGVDMEQAASRLALADTNLINETSNLHDVTARFQRVTGESPVEKLPAARELLKGIPANRAEAVNLALSRQAGITASIENVRAVQAQLDVRRAAFHPKFEARLREAWGKNVDSSLTRDSAKTAELVMSWNIYNGGSDLARVRQFSDALNNARDLRDKSCRDVRQTLSIAYNDTSKLADQEKYLALQVAAIAKARDAYRKQFDIGQRSLLDLLNSENELYQAKRSLVNAQFDREIAYGRVLNATNQLLQRLELSKAETGAVDGADGWEAGEDGAERCPPEVVAAPVIDKARLDARARDNLQQLARSLVLTANAGNTGEKPADSKPVSSKPVVSRADDVVTGRLLAWARSWAAKDLDGYFSFYSPDFKPELSSVDVWRMQRRQRIEAAPSIQVTISEVSAVPASADSMETRFRQRYESGAYTDESERRILWRRVKDQWFIISESGR